MGSRTSSAPVSELELARRSFRRRQTGRSVVVSLVSTAVVAVVVWLLLANSPGWEVTRTTFFNSEYFWSSFPKVWDGLLLNLRVLAYSVVSVSVVAVLLAAARTTKGAVFFPLRFLAAAYTDLFRGLPFIIVLYLIGFGIPALGFNSEPIPAELLGTIALTLTYSSYVAEVLRAGIESVHPSQRVAARSLGLTRTQTLRLIVLPQAVRKVAPPLMNDFVSMQKDVGLVSVIGAVDAVRAAQILNASSFNYTPYIVAGLMFIAMSWPMIRLTDWVTARQQRREQMGGVV